MGVRSGVEIEEVCMKTPSCCGRTFSRPSVCHAVCLSSRGQTCRAILVSYQSTFPGTSSYGHSPFVFLFFFSKFSRTLQRTRMRAFCIMKRGNQARNKTRKGEFSLILDYKVECNTRNAFFFPKETGKRNGGDFVFPRLSSATRK